MIIFLDDSSTPDTEFRTLASCLEEVVPDTILAETPPAMEQCWYIVSCRADFERTHVANLNHFMPCWSQVQLGPAWDCARLQWESDLLERKSTLQAEMVNLFKEAETSEEASVQLETVIEATKSLEAEETEIMNLLAMGYVPCAVPADGNCGAWSLLCLDEGFTKASTMDFSLKQHHATMMKMRTLLQKQWRLVKDYSVWQRLFTFWNLKGLLTAPGAPAASGTPKKKRKQDAADFSPEKVQKKASNKKGPAAVDGCTPAGFGKPAEKSSGVLARAGAVVETQAETNEKRARKSKEQADADLEVLSGEEDETVQMRPKFRITRAYHTRVKKKVPQSSELQLQACMQYFNQIRVNFHEFTRVHMRILGLYMFLKIG